MNPEQEPDKDPGEGTRVIHYKGYKIEITPISGSLNPFRLLINGKPIMYDYVTSEKTFYSHLFFQPFSNIEDMVKAFIDVNPSLADPHPHHSDEELDPHPHHTDAE